MALSVSMMILRVPGIVFLGLAHRNVGRVAQANAFQVMFRVIMDDDIELLTLEAQKIAMHLDIA